MDIQYAKNMRSGFVRTLPITTDHTKVPVHDPSANPVIPISHEPITKDEYIEYIEQLRSEPEFSRLPFASWAYEEFPEFAETPEQIAAINEEWTRETMIANEKKDLEAEKKALEKRIERLKKMAKKNKAIKIAKKRIQDIITRQTEMLLADEDVKPNQ